MVVWSVLGFLVGVGLTYALIRAFGGVTYFGVKAIMEGNSSVEHARSLAHSTCMAHASWLDQLGNPEAAGLLVLLTSRGIAEPTKFFMVTHQEEKRLLDKYSKFLFQGTLLGGHRPEALQCDIHGESLWGGHIECLRCKRVFELENTKTNATPMTNAAPEICPCSFRLLPPSKEEAISTPSTGKTICKHCYKDRVEDNDTQPVLKAEPEDPLQLQPAMIFWGGCPNCEAESYLRYGPGERPPLQFHPDACPVCGHTAEDEEDEEVCEGHAAEEDVEEAHDD